MLPRAVPSARPKLPANRKRHDGLARPSGHRKQYLRLAAKDRFNRQRYSDLLIVAWRLRTDIVVWSRKLFSLLGLRYADASQIPLPEVGGRRESRQMSLATREVVDLDDVHTVRRIRELEPKHFRI